MDDIEPVKELASKFYLGENVHAKKDMPLWDRTLRIVRNCENLLLHKEISQSNLAIERFALLCAAYFSEACLKQNCSSFSIPKSFKQADHGEKSAQIFKACAGRMLSQVKQLSETKVEKVCKIITDSHNKQSVIPEARLIHEAICLEEIGIIGILNELRAMGNHERSITALLNGWNMKDQYGYWEAIISDGMILDCTKTAARKRLESARQFIEYLKDEHGSLDLASNN